MGPLMKAPAQSARRSKRGSLGGLASLFLGLAALASAGCSREPDVVLYCALDEEFARGLIEAFERESGLVVNAEYDIEQTKTVGLVGRLRAEVARPRCDVFWNNEIAHTVSLANDGLLQAYVSPNAADIPAEFKDAGGMWTGLAARARVFIVNTELADASKISSMWDLVDPAWKGKVGMARPLTGTTLTHAAALYTVIGPERALEYLEKVKSGGVNLTRGNAVTMRLVRDGELAWGWTDTDDYNVARVDGFPVTVVFPDSGPDGVGTLFIPNTVCILKGAPHADAAKKLVDYILSVEVERQLASSRSAQIPLHAALKDMPHPLPLEQMKPMKVDYAQVGAQIAARHEELKEMFIE